MGPMRIPELTLRLLKPLGALAHFKSESNVPVLIHLELRDVFLFPSFLNDTTASS